MHKKKEHHEEHVDETWLIPYADMLTLLLALFIVMFAMGKTDETKFQQIKEEFNMLFSGGDGQFEKDGNAIIPAAGTIGKKTSEESKDNKTSKKAQNKKITSEQKSSSDKEQDKMEEIKNLLEGEAKKRGISEKVVIELTAEGLGISIQDTVLFASGEARVFKNVSPILTMIAKTVAGLDNNIRVVGHTDSLPIKNASFNSNWDLSAMRAINVMHYLVDSANLKPNRFSIQGNGEYTPRYTNATAEGRAKNRRVEIVIIRKYPFVNSDKIPDSVPINVDSAMSKSNNVHNN